MADIEEELVEIEPSEYLESVCANLVHYQQIVEKLEDVIFGYMLDLHQYHLTHYRNEAGDQVFYKLGTTKLDYEVEDDS